MAPVFCEKGMAQGDGSITEIKQPEGKSYSPKHWRVAVSFGTDPLTGKRLKAQRNVRGIKSDACKVEGLPSRGDGLAGAEAERRHAGLLFR